MKPGTHHLRRHFTGANLQVQHRSIAQVDPTARQPVCKVAVAVQVAAPGFPPERSGNGASASGYRRKRLAFPSANAHSHWECRKIANGFHVMITWKIQNCLARAASILAIPIAGPQTG